MANASKLNAELPRYSGHPKGHSFPGPGGVTTEELFDAESWVKRVTIIAESAGWSDKVKARSAVLAFIPSSPIDNWFQVVEEETPTGLDINSWKSLSAGIIKVFSPQLTFTDRAAMLRTMKQKPQERAQDYLNRMKLSFRRFSKGLEPLHEAAYADLTENDKLAKETGENIAQITLDYILQSLFLAGMQETLLIEVTKSPDASTIEKITEVAQRVELANRQLSEVKKQPTIGAVTANSDLVPKSQVAAMIQQALAAQNGNATGPVAAAGPGASAAGNRPSKKDKSRDSSKIWCHHCGVQGHYCNTCTTRQAERAQGKYRATILCPFITKEQWDRLSRDEKQRGKYMVPGAPAPPAGLHLRQRFPTATPTGTISSSAATFAQAVNNGGATASTGANAAAGFDSVNEENSFVNFYSSKN